MATGKYAKYHGFKWTVGDNDVPALAIVVDDASKLLHICEPGDADTNWALAAASHPTVCLHSATNPATEYVKIYHDATNAYIDGVGATSLSLLIAGTEEMSLSATALTVSTPLTVGVDDTGYDVIFFCATSKYKVWLDENGDTNGAWYFGADDYGIDVGFYGQTISNSMIWDASANALVFVAGGITMGVASQLVIPVKASGSTTVGDVWLDTTDTKIHYYATGGEYICTSNS